MANVIIYTSSTCTHCKTAKRYFNENNIDYTEKNVDTDRDALNELIERGHRAVPVIEIDGEEIVGFDQPRVAKLLNL
ncbi:MAG: glutaredoxin family protein [Tissierellia bacterium]|nr:glutaredoxin family protein [Tissierellia bacterium]